MGLENGGMVYIFIVFYIVLFIVMKVKGTIENRRIEKNEIEELKKAKGKIVIASWSIVSEKIKDKDEKWFVRIDDSKVKEPIHVDRIVAHQLRVNEDPVIKKEKVLVGNEIIYEVVAYVWHQKHIDGLKPRLFFIIF